MRSKGSRTNCVVDIPQDFGSSTEKRPLSIGPVPTSDLDISHLAFQDVDGHQDILSSVSCSRLKSLGNDETQPFTLEFFENHDPLASCDSSRRCVSSVTAKDNKLADKVSKSTADIANDDSIVKSMADGLNTSVSVGAKILTSSNNIANGTNTATSIPATFVIASDFPLPFKTTPSYKEASIKGLKPSEDVKSISWPVIKVAQGQKCSELGSSPSETPSMGPRAAWDNNRAERDTRYQALQLMTPTDSVSPHSTQQSEFDQNASPQSTHDPDPRYGEQVKGPHPQQDEMDQPADKGSALSEDFKIKKNANTNIKVRAMSPSLYSTPGQLPNAVEVADQTAGNASYGTDETDTFSTRIALHYNRGSDCQQVATTNASTSDAESLTPRSLRARTEDARGSTTGSELDDRTHGANPEVKTANGASPYANRLSFEDIPPITAAEANKCNTILPEIAQRAFPKTSDCNTLANITGENHTWDPRSEMMPYPGAYEQPSTVNHSSQVQITADEDNKPVIPSLIRRKGKFGDDTSEELKSSDVDKSYDERNLQELTEENIRASCATKSNMLNQQNTLLSFPKHPDFSASSAGEQGMSGLQEPVNRLIQAEEDRGRPVRGLSQGSAVARTRLADVSLVKRREELKKKLSVNTLCQFIYRCELESPKEDVDEDEEEDGDEHQDEDEDYNSYCDSEPNDIDESD